MHAAPYNGALGLLCVKIKALYILMISQQKQTLQRSLPVSTQGISCAA